MERSRSITFTLNNVLPGPYDVKISLTGFRESVRTNVPVTIGQISRVEMTLEVGALTETVTVASEAQRTTTVVRKIAPSIARTST